MAFVSRLPEMEVSRCSKCLVIFGVLLSLLGSVMVLFWGTLFEHLSSQELTLLPGTKTFKNWEVTPVPMYTDIYFFNWTNPQNLANEKPIFTQMGPYRFVEKRTKVGMVWHENKTVTFQQMRHWFFDEENSNGTLADNVTTVNVILLTAVNQKQHERNPAFRVYAQAFQKLEKRETVGNLLFNGYLDDLLTVKRALNFFSDEEESTKFGWFHNRNGSVSHEGVYNMATGEDDLSQRGKVLRWNNKTNSGFYRGKCGHVSGYTGELFAPGISRNDTLRIFNRDLCRSVEVKYSGDTKVRGVDGLRFSGDADTLGSGQCYCGGKCPPAGLLNLTKCSEDVPLYLSYPHFLHADTALLQDVQGLSPDPEKHSFHMTVEPSLGMTIDLKGRFQVNLKLEPVELGLFKKIPKTLYIPVLWTDQRATLTEELAEELRLILSIPSAGRIFFAGVCSIGILIAGIAILRACLCPPVACEDTKASSSSSKPKVFLEDMQVSSSTKLLG